VKLEHRNVMDLKINLIQLERKNLHLTGCLDPADLGLVDLDELVHITGPVDYDLEVQKMENGILAQGQIQATLDCECSRCLKKFEQTLNISAWACHLPLEGEEAAPVEDDSVDLTPYLREDILLAFPQHPLCKVDCSGLPNQSSSRDQTGEKKETELLSSPWSELNKLKF